MAFMSFLRCAPDPSKSSPVEITMPEMLEKMQAKDTLVLSFGHAEVRFLNSLSKEVVVLTPPPSDPKMSDSSRKTWCLARMSDKKLFCLWYCFNFVNDCDLLMNLIWTDRIVFENMLATTAMEFARDVIFQGWIPKTVAAVCDDWTVDANSIVISGEDDLGLDDHPMLTSMRPGLSLYNAFSITFSLRVRCAFAPHATVVVGVAPLKFLVLKEQIALGPQCSPMISTYL